MTASDTSVMAILLAGGQGSRLHELTERDCKPAIQFGDNRRIVDFTVANAVRSGIGRMLVATQYRPASLHDHMTHRWGHALDIALRHGPTVTGTAAGYVGTAAAVTANMAEIDASGVDHVVILSGDHVYDMDLTEMVAAHRASGAEVTVAVDAVPRAQARSFGVLAVEGSRILSFTEKPQSPIPMVDDPSRALVSMGIYVFSWPWLRAALMMDAMEPDSSHDFGHDILPLAVSMGLAHAHRRPDGAYWRDVGTLDAFRQTALDLRADVPPCLLPDRVAAKRDLDPGHLGWIGHTMTMGGLSLTIPRNGRRWTLLDETVVMPGARIETGARLTRAIVAPYTAIPADLTVGEDADEDNRWFRRTAGGTTLITQAMLSRRDAERPRQHVVAAVSVQH